MKTDQQDGSEEASSVEPEAHSSLVNAGYDVSDVLSTHDLDRARRADRPPVKPAVIRAEELLALIRDGVAPDSWDVHGGRGIIHYNPELKTLFIEQTPEVHEAIQEWLDARRREMERYKNESKPSTDRSIPAQGSLIEPDVVAPKPCFPPASGLSELVRNQVAGWPNAAEDLGAVWLEIPSPVGQTGQSLGRGRMPR